MADADRIEETTGNTAVVGTLAFYFDTLPFMQGRVRLSETVFELCGWDFDVWICGLRYGSGRIFNVDAPASKFEKGWKVKSSILNEMYMKLEAKGFQTMLVIRTSDDRVIYAMLGHILKQRAGLEVDDEFVIIPRHLLHTLEEPIL